jgi:hypothetical protein
MQYAGNLTRYTRLSVTSYSQPLINTKYQIISNKLIVNNNLVLSHSMCAAEQNEATVMPETKEELIENIMNVDKIESEEFPMSPEIIVREQKKDTHLKKVMKKSDKCSEKIVERSTVITYDNKIYIPL